MTCSPRYSGRMGQWWISKLVGATKHIHMSKARLAILEPKIIYFHLDFIWVQINNKRNVIKLMFPLEVVCEVQFDLDLTLSTWPWPWIAKENIRNRFLTPKNQEKEVIYIIIGRVVQKLNFQGGSRWPSWIYGYYRNCSKMGECHHRVQYLYNMKTQRKKCIPTFQVQLATHMTIWFK